MLDARDESNLVQISTCPLPNHSIYAKAGRFGAHNIHENVPLPTPRQNDQIVLGTFFNGGLRAYDISNSYQPKEVGVFMPSAPPGAPTGTIQMNDVIVDERAIVYTVDRRVGGPYILEMDFRSRGGAPRGRSSQEPGRHKGRVDTRATPTTRIGTTCSTSSPRATPARSGAGKGASAARAFR